MIKRILWTILGTTLLLITACTSEKLHYEEGFPTEKSAGLTNFLADYFNRSYLFISKEDSYVFTGDPNLSDDGKIKFYTMYKDELEEFYEPALESSNPSTTLRNMHRRSEQIQHLVEDNPSLPRITCTDTQKVFIESLGHEKQIDLKEQDVSFHEGDKVQCLLLRVNEKGFKLQIDSRNTKEAFYLLATSDLAHVNIFTSETIENAVEQEKVTPYYDMLKDNLSDTYASILYNVYIDTQNHTLKHIDDENLTEGELIFINGDERVLEKGYQKIQYVEDYLQEKDDIYAEVFLDYKHIGNHVDFQTSDSVSIGKVIHFSKDFILLFINYNAPFVGTSGSTNVLIDIQDKENPIYYVVDLDRQF